MTYYEFKNEEGEGYGSFKTFYLDKTDRMWEDEATEWFKSLVDYTGEHRDDISLLLKLKERAEYAGFDLVLVAAKNEPIYMEIQKAKKALSGWYWVAEFPGCLPDGDFFGPFETEEKAVNNARSLE